MKPHAADNDPLDRLLSQQPVRPTVEFTDKTLARIRSVPADKLTERELDQQLESWLTNQPLPSAPDFAGRVLASATQASTPEPTGTSHNWLRGLSALAAVLAVGALGVVAALRSPEATRTKTVAMSPTVTAPMQSVSTATSQPASTAIADSGEEDSVLYLADINENMGGYSDLLLMQDALASASALSDSDTIDTLDMLIN